MKNNNTFYCLKGPEGQLYWETLQPYKSHCWSYGGFSIVCDHQGEGWRMLYWKRESASMRAALKLGYSFARVKLVEIPGG